MKYQVSTRKQGCSVNEQDEQRRIDELYALIRELYREKQAEDLINSFNAVFATQDDAEERQRIIDYWSGFYRLRKYRRLKKRRRPTYTERITACSACGYPASHRHHLWDVAMHGENQVTIQLCANCHELHHLMYNALVKTSNYSRDLVLHILRSGRVGIDVAQLILGWCLATIRYEADNGWVDERRATMEWVERRLNWSHMINASL
jgi:ribosomal protein L37E